MCEQLCQCCGAGGDYVLTHACVHSWRDDNNTFASSLSVCFHRGWFFYHPAGNCHSKELQTSQHSGVLQQLHTVSCLLLCFFSLINHWYSRWLRHFPFCLSLELINCGYVWSSVEEAPFRIFTMVREFVLLILYLNLQKTKHLDKIIKIPSPGIIRPVSFLRIQSCVRLNDKDMNMSFRICMSHLIRGF